MEQLRDMWPRSRFLNGDRIVLTTYPASPRGYDLTAGTAADRNYSATSKPKAMHRPHMAELSLRESCEALLREEKQVSWMEQCALCGMFNDEDAFFSLFTAFHFFFCEKTSFTRSKGDVVDRPANLKSSDAA